MKILEKKEISPMRVRCHCCDSLLEVEPKDVTGLWRKKFYDFLYPGQTIDSIPRPKVIGSALMGEIPCPNCKQKFHVEINDEAFAAQVRICLYDK